MNSLLLTIVTTGKHHDQKWEKVQKATIRSEYTSDVAGFINKKWILDASWVINKYKTFSECHKIKYHKKLDTISKEHHHFDSDNPVKNRLFQLPASQYHHPQ
jgi:RPA family protein